MKTYKIPVSWIVSSTVEVDANSLEDALKLAEEADLPPQSGWEYVDASWEVDRETSEYLYNEEEDGL